MNIQRWIVVAALSSMAVGAQAHLLTNGGFESFDISKATGSGAGYYVFGSTDQGIDDWTISATSVDIVTPAGSPYPVRTGNAALDLVGTPGPGGISQDFAVEAGKSYTVSFWGQSTGGGLNEKVRMEVSHGGFDAMDFTVTSGSYNQYSMSFVAGATGSATLSLLSDPGNTSNGNTFIDDVEAVPEPATLALLAGGALAMARRRKNA